jgi:outer membrane protein OmpA-like peptidoglycan-associated protein
MSDLELRSGLAEPRAPGYNAFMRFAPGLVCVAAVLVACGGYTRPVLIEDEGRRAPMSSEAELTAARERIKDIEDRIARGDLPKIQFEFDKDEIATESYNTLDRILEVILSSPRLKLMIHAHTDDVGSDEYNMDLSWRRAKAVTDYLASKGVPPPSMRFHGYGATQPLVSNATDEGRAKNRRVEFYVTTREWSAVY